MNYVDLLHELLEVLSNNATVSLKPTEVAALVRPVLSPYQIKVTTSRHHYAKQNEIIVSGVYRPMDEITGDSVITITLQFQPKIKTICLNDVDLLDTGIEICSTVAHELQHRKQYKQRDFDDGFYYCGNGTRNQLYYGDHDEIDAYAYGLAVRRVLYTYLNYENPPFESEHAVETYYKVFGDDHYIPKLFIKYLNKYIKQLTKKVIK